MKVISFLSTLCIILFNFSGCFIGELLFSVKPWEREKMYNYYTQDSNYFPVWGGLEVCSDDYDDGRERWVINFNESCIAYLEDEGLIKRFIQETSADFLVVNKNQKILEEAGFYENLEKAGIGQNEQGSPIIKIMQSPKIWFDGWGPVLVSVEMEDVVYLDYETGKANFLDWIQNDLQ